MRMKCPLKCHSRKFMCTKVRFRSFAKVNERERFCARTFLYLRYCLTVSSKYLFNSIFSQMRLWNSSLGSYYPHTTSTMGVNIKHYLNDFESFNLTLYLSKTPKPFPPLVGSKNKSVTSFRIQMSDMHTIEIRYSLSYRKVQQKITAAKILHCTVKPV